MRLFPKTEDFFILFKKSAENLVTATAYLESIVNNGVVTDVDLKRMEELEHTGDRITHDTMERLNSTFITPFDREDIHLLGSRLDDVMDFLYAATEAMTLYKVNPIPESIRDLSRVLVQLAVEIERALARLADLKRPEMILAICIEINRLENEADNIHRRALASLFENEKDAITIIKIKEILEDLETATDKCEDVANVIEGIVLKNA
jgi:predicted phosphate transport protein (TIGR00153 family)